MNRYKSNTTQYKYFPIFNFKDFFMSKLAVLAVGMMLLSACKLMPKEEKDKQQNKTGTMAVTTTNTDWKHATNIYEVNVRQYTAEGTFNAFLKELPRLKDMGVQVLWFMPITPIAKEKMKGSLGSYYACSDYTSINPEFGTLQDFKNWWIRLMNWVLK
ncbi:alpha-amylase family glycosyl hydrolase [Niabella hibiscisoli]